MYLGLSFLFCLALMLSVLSDRSWLWFVFCTVCHRLHDCLPNIRISVEIIVIVSDEQINTKII